MGKEDLIDLDDLDKEIDIIKNWTNHQKIDNPPEEEKNYKLVTVQKEYLRIKVLGIIISVFLKLLYKIFFLLILFFSLKIPVIKHFILDVYFAHYLFFFMFILFTIDIIFVFTKFMSDVQEILMENIYIEVVTKQEKITLN